MARFMEHYMAIDNSKNYEQMEMLKKKIAFGLDSYVSMNLSCFFSVIGLNLWIRS